MSIITPQNIFSVQNIHIITSDNKMMPMQSTQVYTFSARARDLPKKDMFGKSGTYIPLNSQSMTLIDCTFFSVDPYLVLRIPVQDILYKRGQERRTGKMDEGLQVTRDISEK